MANKDRFSKLKVYKYTPGGLVLSFIIIFAGIGTYVVSQSKANNVTSSEFYNSVNADSSPNVTQITDSVGPAGLQTVNQITPGGKLTYNNPENSDYSSICYYLRSTSPNKKDSATVEIVGKGNSKEIEIAVGDKYSSYCVESSTDTQKSYNVNNASGPTGPNVLVYQAITTL